MSDKLLLTAAPSQPRAIADSSSETEEERRKRKEARALKRKSRWDDGGGASKVAVTQSPSTPALSTMIDVASADHKQQQAHILQLQIREATNKLGLPNLGIPPDRKDRSPSPEPIYNNRGVRMNTRYERTKTRLINLRNTAITQLMAVDPSYKPPAIFAYKNSALEDKIEIPQEQYPQYNFMGLILGPRGHFLDRMKEKHGCKMVIKGKGSLKDGMTGVKKDGTKFDGLDEPMHVEIKGPTAEAVKAAGDEIRRLIKMQIEDPDCEKMVALRAAHIHELKVLNGTVRDNETKCLSCGAVGHPTWQCLEKDNVTASIICTACGGVGHIGRDCKSRRPGELFNKKAAGADMDEEYAQFLKDTM